MNLHKFIRRICAAAVAAALTLSLCTPVLAEGIAALPAAETGGIPIDPAHFPDANFLKYVEKIIDTDHSGTLSQEERNATVIYVLGMGIKDLTGIEFFPELENLDCSENQLTQLDVSKNPKLERLVCYENKLTSLDVSGNTSLTELHCYTNQLTSLNLGENANLDILNCVVNRLTSLDLSGNANLTRLACSSNLLTSLDVSNNPNLILLDCERNLLTSLNVSKNTELDTLDCSGNKLSLELSDSGRFDLSTLPGFDADRAVWPEGVTVENGILTVPYNTTSLTYRYDVRGNGADDDYKEFVLTFDEVKEPDLPDDSSAPADTGSTAGGAIAAVAVGGAAVWGGYELVTRVMLHSLLPEGAAIPASRGQLALLVWNTAGRPEPVNAPAFADVTDPDTARAAQWCVEQGLLTLKKDGSFDPDGWTPKFRVIQVWNKAFPKQ
ncbi:MAG: leucine-rich repeat domain-containing protein [Faecalibacterium sp.]|nr:leucine-rich repeat domain-containing protein [Faecalibacterium sp.]